jgi:MSHA biogenesis protein MshE
MNDQVRRKKVRLGELLLEQKVISQEQLTAALAEQKRSGRKLGRVLTDMGFVREETLHEVLAKHLQIPFVDVRQLTLDANVVRLKPMRAGSARWSCNRIAAASWSACPIRQT